jgi:hypothetical protein
MSCRPKYGFGSGHPATTRNCSRSQAPRNPYPGKPGVVEEGALADLLLG